MGDKPGGRVRGISHLALNSSDMAKTVAFYERLGIPLVKTMEIAAYRFQHFFFDIGNGDCLAYFCYADGVGQSSQAGQEMLDGAMNHVAFGIDPADVQAWWDFLTEEDIPFGCIIHNVPGDDGRPADAFNDLDLIGPDTYAVSFYLQDPDGAQIEFAAWFPAWDRFGPELVGTTTERSTSRVERDASLYALSRRPPR